MWKNDVWIHIFDKNLNDSNFCTDLTPKSLSTDYEKSFLTMETRA